MRSAPSSTPITRHAVQPQTFDDFIVKQEQRDLAGDRRHHHRRPGALRKSECRSQIFGVIYQHTSERKMGGEQHEQYHDQLPVPDQRQHESAGFSLFSFWGRMVFQDRTRSDAFSGTGRVKNAHSTVIIPNAINI